MRERGAHGSLGRLGDLRQGRAGRPLYRGLPADRVGQCRRVEPDGGADLLGGGTPALSGQACPGGYHTPCEGAIAVLDVVANLPGRQHQRDRRR